MYILSIIIFIHTHLAVLQLYTEDEKGYILYLYMYIGTPLFSSEYV